MSKTNFSIIQSNLIDRKCQKITLIYFHIISPQGHETEKTVRGEREFDKHRIIIYTKRENGTKEMNEIHCGERREKLVNGADV